MDLRSSSIVTLARGRSEDMILGLSLWKYAKGKLLLDEGWCFTEDHLGDALWHMFWLERLLLTYTIWHTQSGASIFFEMSAIKSALSGCLDFCCYFPVIPICLFVCLLYLVPYTLAVLTGSLKRLISTLYALSSLFRLILDLQFFSCLRFMCYF